MIIQVISRGRVNDSIFVVLVVGLHDSSPIPLQETFGVLNNFGGKYKDTSEYIVKGYAKLDEGDYILEVFCSAGNRSIDYTTEPCIFQSRKFYYETLSPMIIK